MPPHLESDWLYNSPSQLLLIEKAKVWTAHHDNLREDVHLHQGSGPPIRPIIQVKPDLMRHTWMNPTRHFRSQFNAGRRNIIQMFLISYLCQWRACLLRKAHILHTAVSHFREACVKMVLRWNGI